VLLLNLHVDLGPMHGNLRGRLNTETHLSPLIDSTVTSTSSPIMMLCLGLRVRTSKRINSPSAAGHLPNRPPCAAAQHHGALIAPDGGRR
jgi:hypothetical protein